MFHQGYCDFKAERPQRVGNADSNNVGYYAPPPVVSNGFSFLNIECASENGCFTGYPSAS